MRKSIIPAAAAIAATLSFPAQAAKYTCSFAQANQPVGSPCVIDPTTTTTSCQRNFGGGNLVGLCAAGKTDDDKTEALLCVIGVPASVAEVNKSLMEQNSADALKILAEKPGFAAQDIVIFPTQARPSLSALLYRETQSAPVLSAACN
ncbi:hypothetical protein ACQR18_19790 [Bradyrhizobium oligotrophicum]|uniref:hypothetical protein n=1 Tax=Bradyrhizobium oligotrophicum TaxID=44255 RepID=UPI003EC06062